MSPFGQTKLHFPQGFGSSAGRGPRSGHDFAAHRLVGEGGLLGALGHVQRLVRLSGFRSDGSSGHAWRKKKAKYTHVIDSRRQPGENSHVLKPIDSGRIRPNLGDDSAFNAQPIALYSRSTLNAERKQDVISINVYLGNQASEAKLMPASTK